MSRYDDEDLDNEIIPVHSPFRTEVYGDDGSDEDISEMTAKVSNCVKLADSLEKLNISENAQKIKKTMEYISQTYLMNRLQNGIKSEDMKRSVMARINEIITSFSPQELINLYTAISDAGTPDLDRLFGDGSSGININMQGPTTNHNVYDNSVKNTQVNQTANFQYANDKDIKGLDVGTVKKMGKITEVTNLFKAFEIPRQAQVEYKPEEKIETTQDKQSDLIEANFEEIKSEEKKFMNED